MTETHADIERQLVDQDALTSYLGELLNGDGPFEIERHIAGHSCETFFIKRNGENWVLRRPPLAVYLPTAHDVLREYRVLEALTQTNVRSPVPVLKCEDVSIIGAPFYVMKKVDGVVLRTDIPASLDASDSRTSIGPELIRALAELHLVDFTKVGLDGFGKPSGYLERQMKRWSGQLELATSITKNSREVPQMWDVRDWLVENLPESPPSVIVHGDYKLDNVMFAEQPPARLVAIFDWEMSTIGDPLADLGWMMSYWREPNDPPNPIADSLNTLTTRPDFSSRAELIDLYQEQTGTSARNLKWYVVAAVWKLACLLEGSYGRHLLGTTDDPFFAQLRTAIPALASTAMDISKGSLDL